MSVPYVCPRCKGDKVIVLKKKNGKEETVPCPNCDETGIVWEKDANILRKRA